jgi:FkbM family methyltransferase
VARARWLAQRLPLVWRSAVLVDTPVRWAAREILPGDRVGRYVPRGSAHAVFMRHHSHDSGIVLETFGWRLYEPPAPVRATLDAIDRPLRVLDLGGHVGVYGAWALTAAPGATLLSLEPDPDNFALLERAAQRAGPAWTALQAAAAPESGWARFTALGEPGSHLAGADGGGGIEVVTLDVLPLLAQVDMAKIDIEGGEWAIVHDPRWAGSAPSVVALEFHPELCPAEDYEAAAIAAVAAAGMEHAIIEGTPEGAGMLWAWRGPEPTP